MDNQTYQKELEFILNNRVRSLTLIYQYMRSTKSWKIVSKRCSSCNQGFNQNAKGKFETHICKPTYSYKYV